MKLSLPEYIEALSEIFKGETLDTITLPKPEELTDEYFSKMYPETQRDEDTAKGLVSYRPSWWKDKADASIVGSAEEIWGQAFIRSMQSEATQLQDSLLPHRIHSKTKLHRRFTTVWLKRRRRRDTRPLASNYP